MFLYKTGYLAAPAKLQQQTLMETGVVHFNRTAPFTLAGVPILQYSVYVHDYTTGEENIINTTSTEYIHSEPQCGVEVSISAWNAVGEGERTAPLSYYTKEGEVCRMTWCIQ